MKKNMFSKLFCLMLALSVVLCLGVVASAEETASGQLNANISWTLEDGVLTLTGTGATPEYTASPFAAYKADVTSVVVDEGITKLGAYLFYQMTGVTQVQLPSTLTHFQNRAFAYCSGLTQITIPKSVTYLGPYAFMNSGLTDVYFESATPPSISGAGAPLGGCKYVVHVPCNSTAWTTDTITNWGGGSKSLAMDIHSFENNQCVHCGVYRCGDNILATFAEGVLTLEGTGSTFNYELAEIKLVSYPFLSIKNEVKEIVVGEGITILGKHIFYQMPIEKVTLPQSLTHIDTRALGGGGKLTEVVIPGKLANFGYNCLVGSGATDIYMMGGVPANISTTPLGGLTYNLHIPCNDESWTNEMLNKLGGTRTVVYDHNYEGNICTICGVAEGGSNLCGEKIVWNFDEETGVLTLEGTGSTFNYELAEIKLESYPFLAIKDQVKEIVVGEGITILGKHIFYQMPIEKVTLPQSLTHIDTRALGGGGKLTEVVIYGKLANFGYNCLVGSGATDIYLLGGVPTNISTTPLGGLTYKLHIPCNDESWTDEMLTKLGGNRTMVWEHQFEDDTCTVCQGQKVFALVKDGVEESYCCTLTEACDSRYTGQMIRLLKDTVEDAVLSKDLYIDLAGHDLSGVINCGEERLFIVDSSTDEYNADNCGIFSCVDLDGNALVPMAHVNNKLANNYHYLAVAVEGGYAFHRFDLAITHISLDPSVTGMGYKAAFAGTDALLEQIEGFGYQLQLGENPAITRVKAMDSYGVLTLRIKNYDAANHGQTALKAIPVIVLTDGTVIEGTQQSTNLYDTMQYINDTADTYNAQQLDALRTMIASNATMQTWNLVNLWSDGAAEAALQTQIAGITDNDALTAQFESYDAQGYIHLTKTGEAYVVSTEGKPVMLKNVAPNYVSKLTAADYNQLMALGATYADNMDALVYGNMKTAINTETTNQIDCSSFLKLVLSGVAYENSKYVTDANTPMAGFGVQFPDNPYSDKYGADRYLSNELAQYAWDQGFAFLPNEDASNIQPGDVVFFSTRQETDGFFMDITHAGIFVEYQGQEILYVFHCGDNTDTEKDLIRYIKINLNGDTVFNNALVLIARFPV